MGTTEKGAGNKATAKRSAPAKSKNKHSAAAKTAAKESPAKPGSQKKSTRSSASAKPRATDIGTHQVVPYEPKSHEEYMSDAQLEHFRVILENWKRELMEEVDRTIHLLQDGGGVLPDSNDRATQETDLALELRARDRGRKLIRKVDAALERIANGSYGYCEETGEEIGLRRLEARPIATLCLEAQERHERTERHYSKREGRSDPVGEA
ncbi:MAG: RNA polymerase-binding protein DksA [Pseudomonadota bacterium]